jgi:sulfide:quinone oxidoreductase
VRVVVLGAGFGGLEVAARLSEALGDAVSVDLLDKGDGFVFGFSKLDVMFGRATPQHVTHHYGAIDKPGVRFTQTTVRAIDVERRRVETDAGVFEGDALVVALGADLDVAATPGLAEAGREFYSLSGAFSLRDELAAFERGRVVIGVTSTPFKCPPAPSETALLLHDLLERRGVRPHTAISLVMPFGAPIPPSADASAALVDAFAARGIEWLPERRVAELDPARRVATFGDGDELEFDLFLGVPMHRAPNVVVDAGLTVDGWIPVDPHTLETTHPNVFAVGDVTSAGTPKAGVFAEGQARVVADQLITRHCGGTATGAYDGRGVCYLEFGTNEVATVDVTFRAGRAPAGVMQGPSAELAASKVRFGAERIARWFDRDWATTQD